VQKLVSGTAGTSVAGVSDGPRNYLVHVIHKSWRRSCHEHVKLEGRSNTGGRQSGEIAYDCPYCGSGDVDKLTIGPQTDP
jgi:hypothetical protein